MRKLFVGVAAMALIAVWSMPPRAQQQSSGPVIPIEGLDIVMLLQGKEVQGKEDIAVVRGRFKYIFSSQETKAVFEKDPAQYEIGPYCQRMGAPTTGNADLWAVHKGHVYLFGSDGCVKAFKESPDEFIEPAAAEWKPTAAQVARGRELLEKAVAAMGGAATLDGMTTYREKRSTPAKRRDGTDYDASTEIIRVFPDGLRQVQVRQFGTIVTAFHGEQGFVEFQGGGRSNVRPVPPEARTQMDAELWSDPVFLLRERKAASFQAAAGKAEGGLEIVDVKVGTERFAVAVESASGRVVSIAQVRRGPSGKFGNVAVKFSDYRAAGALQVPYRAEVSFNGQPAPDRSYVVAEVEVNKPVEPSLFAMPKGAPQN